MTKQIRLQVRRDTSANWASANPVLADGEIGYDTTEKNQKIGDGVTAWDSLPWTGSGGDVEGPATSVADRVVVFSDATGKVLKDSGFTLAADPLNAERFLIADDIRFRNMVAQDISFKNMGITESIGAYKYPMKNPSFWSNGAEDTSGWTATAGDYVTVNSTAVVEDESMLGSHSWRINITVTQLSGSKLTIRKTGCQNLSNPKRLEFAHKWGVTPDATTRMDAEVWSDNQWERWQYPQFTVQQVTQWRNPALNDPVLDEDFEDFTGEEEIYCIYSNLPVGTYDLTFGGISLYGYAVVYLQWKTDYKSRAMGLDITGADDGPVTWFSDGCPVLRLVGIQADAPETQCMGDVWIDTTATPVVKISDGTNWISLN